MQPGTLEAFWNLLTASVVFLQEESCINALNKAPLHPPLPLSAFLCDKQGVYVVNETLSPHHNVMEMNYIYCVPCHNLLLNKRTVLEKSPVMICVAARGQCGPAEVTGGAPVWSRYHRWMLREPSHHLSRTILSPAAAPP